MPVIVQLLVLCRAGMVVLRLWTARERGRGGVRLGLILRGTNGSAVIAASVSPPWRDGARGGYPCYLMISAASGNDSADELLWRILITIRSTLLLRGVALSSLRFTGMQSRAWLGMALPQSACG